MQPVVCILLTISSMSSTRRRTLALAIAGVLLMASPAFAQAHDFPPPHVRPEGGMKRLVDEAARRSPSLRESIDRLEALAVTVYIRPKVFARSDLLGRVALQSSVGSRRYLVIELACGRSELTQMTALAHELFHALEIAEEPSVVNASTMAAFYSRIGTQTGDSGGLRTFETEAAAAAGQLAHRQLLTSTTRHGHGT